MSHGIVAVQKHAISMTQDPKPPLELETAEQRRCRARFSREHGEGLGLTEPQLPHYAILVKSK